MEIKNYGICGACTAQILDMEIPDIRKFKPTLSLVLAGTNDACNIPVLHSASEMRESYKKLICALEDTGSKIILMTIPPVIESLFKAHNNMAPWHDVSPMERITSFNKNILELAAAHSCEVVDLYSEFMKHDLEDCDSLIRNASNGGGDDACHPTYDGYSLIAWMLFNKIREIGADTSRIACIGDSITYGAYASGGGTAGGYTYPGRLGVFLQPEKRTAKKVADSVKKSVIYQMFLRSFTHEGTLAAAEKLLPRVAETGADIVYLCPVVTADDDARREFWSSRQKASGCDNAKSPYRLMDYYKIDPEYGTDDDMRSFVASAHANGMKVMLDLVYYHCGPSLAARHPEFVLKNPDGTPKSGEWSFPELDFTSEALRKYLFENMEYFVREFDVDGYRCDVGSKVPLDFWEEGRRRIERIKSDIIMLCEGESERVDEQLATFDMNYSFTWATCLVECFRGLYPVSKMVRKWTEMNHQALAGARFLRAFDNHDIANDVYAKRFELLWGSDAVEAAMLIDFMIDGIPFIYNGYDENDTSRHSIFANRGEFVINRSASKKGRIEFLKKISLIRRSERALWDGETHWFSTTSPEYTVSFERVSGSERIMILVNTTRFKRHFTFDLASSDERITLLERGFAMENNVAVLEPYGFVVMKSKTDKGE